MLNIHLTLRDVVGMLRTIADREPERIGKSETGGCVYAVYKDGVLVPVCIIGQMFADLGLLRLLLNEPNDLGTGYAACMSSCSVGYGFWSTLADEYGITVDTDAQAFAHSVQRKQDENDTWGEAFAKAVQEYRDNETEALSIRLDNLFV